MRPPRLHGFFFWELKFFFPPPIFFWGPREDKEIFIFILETLFLKLLGFQAQPPKNFLARRNFFSLVKFFFAPRKIVWCHCLVAEQDLTRLKSKRVTTGDSLRDARAAPPGPHTPKVRKGQSLGGDHHFARRRGHARR